ncbi:MAG: Asp23/Gls24 family envelope stress response protein [Clostridia bacterium]|nr:Asp23/Gls24 family envelope stress response protein [Clostridia bacterium]
MEDENLEESIIPIESGDIITDEDTKGISISEEVVATIAGIAAQEVKGVASMNANGIGEMLGRKTKGVKVQIGEKDTIIDINVTVEYGARIPDIAWEVQNKVKTQVEAMTGLNVVSVNVHIQGVSVPKKKQEVKVATQEETIKDE